MNKKETPFELRCSILGDFWFKFKDEDENDWEDYLEYNDLGLPLAHALAEGLIEANSKTKDLINESWNSLMDALEIEDSGFRNLEELLESEE
jgi:hypothetical protein